MLPEHIKFFQGPIFAYHKHIRKQQRSFNSFSSQTGPRHSRRHDFVFCQDSGTQYPLSKHLALVGLPQGNVQCFAYKSSHCSLRVPGKVERNDLHYLTKGSHISMHVSKLLKSEHLNVQLKEIVPQLCKLLFYICIFTFKK